MNRQDLFHFSQGALRVKRHWGSRSAAHQTWRKMRERCNNPRADQWKWYGAKGVKVCERWNDSLTGFVSFVEDMGERPDGMTLDRIDAKGNYEKSNCRWATKRTQILGQDKTIKVTIDGVEMSLSEAAKRRGLTDSCVRFRLKKGLSMEQALNPIDRRRSGPAQRKTA